MSQYGLNKSQPVRLSSVAGCYATPAWESRDDLMGRSGHLASIRCEGGGGGTEIGLARLKF